MFRDTLRALAAAITYPLENKHGFFAQLRRPAPFGPNLLLRLRKERRGLAIGSEIFAAATLCVCVRCGGGQSGEKPA
jgi:hypothetical protein